MLEQYPISDLLIWIEEKTLTLNADFQRRNVWPRTAKIYLIDTILKKRPMPKIYFRAITDLKTRRSLREVVDGQQRLRTISEFVSGRFQLNKRANEYAGMYYNDLDDETQREFLEYRIGVEQLFNADNETVLDIFQRLNSFSFSLNPQELRHGTFQGEFRSAVVAASRRWGILWDRYRIIGLRQQLRMADDELMAQLFGVVLEGVTDGGQPATARLYKKYDEELPSDAESNVDLVLEFIVSNLSNILTTALARSPHFLMLFAAVAHALIGIPYGGMEDDMPQRDERALADLEIAKNNLGKLADILETRAEDVTTPFSPFAIASAGTTQRIRSRRIRFAMMYRALLSEQS